MSARIRGFRNVISPIMGVLGAALFLAAAATSPPALRRSQTRSSSPDPLKCTVADGFTLASVGDLIIENPESADPHPDFQRAVEILRSADVAIGNFEGSVIDIRHFDGYPQPYVGGTWFVDSPSVPADLKKMGFSMVNRANNHTTDWGIEGMVETDRRLDDAGIVHAGTGRNLAAARAPQYLETPKGRVALVGMASTFPPMSPAADPSRQVPGRPGVNALHATRITLVTPAMMQQLVELRAELPGPPRRTGQSAAAGTPKDLTFLGNRFRLSDHVGTTYEMDPGDLAGILRNLREGKESADFEIATIHCHDPGNWSEQPPDYLVALAHDAIDNGADAFVGHGPHRLRGIEIYKGKPIFYSLGNFFFEEFEQQPMAPELYSVFHVDPETGIPAEFQNMRQAREFPGDLWFHSVIAVSRYRHGRLEEVRLYPVDLGADRRWNERGVPRMASPELSHRILETLQKESRPFGTMIEIDGNIGVIRVQPAS